MDAVNCSFVWMTKRILADAPLSSPGVDSRLETQFLWSVNHSPGSLSFTNITAVASPLKKSLPQLLVEDLSMNNLLINPQLLDERYKI